MEETGHYSETNKALHNDLVLTTIFDFLDAKDLQSCRLVCSKWEQISRSYFAKSQAPRKVIIDGDENSEKLDNFMETFSGALVMPFTKFCFKGSFPANKFEDFFNSWPTIQELFLEFFSLTDTDGKIIPEYIFNNSNFLYLKTLSYISNVDHYHHGKTVTEFIVRLSQIRSIKNLYLKGLCCVDFDYPICPEELSLQGEIRFVREREKIPRPICLNYYIDLKNVRKMGVSKLLFYGHTNVTVDVTDCQCLENLSHDCLTLVGLSTQSKIKELKISTPCDLSLLPETLERLELRTDRNVSCSGEINLPHLKHLYTDNGRFLNKFLNCPNLTDLIIGDHYWHRDPVPIPLRVSRLFLNQSYSFLPNNPAQLDYLHLELPSWAFSLAMDTLETVQYQTLVISFQSNDKSSFSKHKATLSTSQGSMSGFIRIVELQSARGGIIAVGGIEWDADSYSFLARVDRKSAFYLFTNGQGRGIDQLEFEKLMQLKRDCTFLV